MVLLYCRDEWTHGHPAGTVGAPGRPVGTECAEARDVGTGRASK